MEGKQQHVLALMLPDACDAALHIAGDLHHPALLVSLSERSLVDLHRNPRVQRPPFSRRQRDAAGDLLTSAITPTQPAMTAAFA